MGLKHVIVAVLGIAASTAAFAFFQGGGQAAQSPAGKMVWSSPDRKDKVVMTPAEWRRKRNASDSFAKRIATQPKLFVIGDEHALG